MNPKVPKIPFLEKDHHIYFSLECYYFFFLPTRSHNLSIKRNLPKFFAKIEQTFLSRHRFYIIWYSLCLVFILCLVSI
jgi:hypothetical protein